MGRLRTWGLAFTLAAVAACSDGVSKRPEVCSSRAAMTQGPECRECHQKHANHPVSAKEDINFCKLCHGADLRGDREAISCDTCHAGWRSNCTFCHGRVDNPTGAPPRDAHGGTATTLRSVGAHSAHVDAGLAAPLDCTACHVKPQDALSPGHMNGDAGVAFALPVSSGWDRAAGTCGVYCHGNFRGGNAGNLPLWTSVGTGQAGCGTCHGLPPPAPHPQVTMCWACHTETMASDGSIAHPEKHVDGLVQVVGGACDACHGNAQNPAPPRDTTGGTSTALVTVGAHQQHLGARIASPVACAECHLVPGSAGDPGHIDASPAELTFGALATHDGGVTPQWNRALATCGNAYCHGATLGGGSNTSPRWTTVDGSQAACGTCHGLPPPPPHPAYTQCSMCHPDTMDADGGIAHPDKHIDGVVEVVSGACDTCHGSSQNAAPPRDTTGGTSTALVTVGAHQQHLGATGSAAVACSECHVVPTSMSSPGHIDTGPAEVTFGALAAAGGASPAWNRGAATCTASYCHGAFPGGLGANAPLWTSVGTGQAACGTCHAVPAAGGWHARHPGCARCHPDVTDGGTAVTAAAQHVNGTKDVVLPGTFSATSGVCTVTCHTQVSGSWRGAYHPSTWLTAGSPGRHGIVGRREGHGGLDTPPPCRLCHGADLLGGISGVSCEACHPGFQNNCSFGCHN